MLTTEMNNSNSSLSSKTPVPKRLAILKRLLCSAVCRNLKHHQDGVNMKRLYVYKVANVTMINRKTKT